MQASSGAVELPISNKGRQEEGEKARYNYQFTIDGCTQNMKSTWHLPGMVQSSNDVETKHVRMLS